MHYVMSKQISIALTCVALLSVMSVACANRLRLNRLRDALHMPAKLPATLSELNFHSTEMENCDDFALEKPTAAAALVVADNKMIDYDDGDVVVVADDNNDDYDDDGGGGVRLNEDKSVTKRDFMDYGKEQSPMDNSEAMDAVAIAVPLSAVNEAMIEPLLPISDYQEFYDDLLVDAKRQDVKRGGVGMPSLIGCDCKIRNDLLDLGPEYFPRYLLNAVCQQQDMSTEFSARDGVDGVGVHIVQKCRGASYCKALEYKVKVLTRRGRNAQHRAATELQLMPPRRALRRQWRFKTITVAAGCFCSY